jgi:hypothetical protein
MPKNLRAGREVFFNFKPGMVIALKSTQFKWRDSFSSFLGSAERTPRMDLDLCNIKDDIILRITFLKGQNKVFFNDRAHKSLLDGWGEEKSVKLSRGDVDRWERSGVTISVHDCSTPSKEQYQILFDITTVYYFEKRFPGRPIMIRYSPDLTDSTGEPSPSILSDPLEMITYNLDDLPPMEKQAIRSGL